MSCLHPHWGCEGLCSSQSLRGPAGWWRLIQTGHPGSLNKEGYVASHTLALRGHTYLPITFQWTKPLTWLCLTGQCDPSLGPEERTRVFGEWKYFFIGILILITCFWENPCFSDWFAMPPLSWSGFHIGVSLFLAASLFYLFISAAIPFCLDHNHSAQLLICCLLLKDPQPWLSPLKLCQLVSILCFFYEFLNQFVQFYKIPLSRLLSPQQANTCARIGT